MWFTEFFFRKFSTLVPFSSHYFVSLSFYFWLCRILLHHFMTKSAFLCPLLFYELLPAKVSHAHEFQQFKFIWFQWQRFLSNLMIKKPDITHDTQKYFEWNLHSKNLKSYIVWLLISYNRVINMVFFLTKLQTWLHHC